MGPHDIICDPCQLNVVRGLLGSEAWRRTAATRSGDFPGETMVDTMLREERELLAR